MQIFFITYGDTTDYYILLVMSSVQCEHFQHQGHNSLSNMTAALFLKKTEGMIECHKQIEVCIPNFFPNIIYKLPC